MSADAAVLPATILGAALISPISLGVPVDFLLFAAILVGVAIFHRHTSPIAVGGLLVIVAYKLLGPGFKFGPGFGGLVEHIAHEWVIITNLFLLLVGFALLARHFEKSRIPATLPRLLPHDWKGDYGCSSLSSCYRVFLIT